MNASCLSWHVSHVTWLLGHVSLRTFHAQMKSWLNLPFIFLLPLDLMISEEEIYISFFDQRYETCPVIYFYLSSKIFSIYIFNIRIKNSNNGVIYLFTNSRGREGVGILLFIAQVSIWIYIRAEKYFEFYFQGERCVLSLGCLLIRKSNYPKLIRGGKWGEV